MKTCAPRIKDGEYAQLLKHVRDQIQQARIRASLAVNEALTLLYWDIGAEILRRQHAEGWGAQVIKRLSRDLSVEFPDMKGFSERNLKYMRAFAEAYSDREMVQQLVAQIPWGHVLLLLHKVKNRKGREWYVRQTIEHGWSRNMLALHIAQGDYERKGKAVTNFNRTLPAPQSDLARETLKDPYKPSLPTVEEIEQEIAEQVEGGEDSETGQMIRELRAKYGTGQMTKSGK